MRRTFRAKPLSQGAFNCISSDKLYLREKGVQAFACMKLELKQVFDNIGESIKFDYPMDLSEYELFSIYPFITPVNVKGEVFNRAGIVYLNYSQSFTLKLNCDRCLESFTNEFNNSYEQILVSSLENDFDNDEYILVDNNKLDLDELSLSDILLNLPAKLLCSRDCKGLCVKCGANLNQTDCLCVKKEIDPRLSILSELL